jgi:hypothetical protein
MRFPSFFLILGVLLFSIAASAATPVTLTLKPIPLTGDWKVTGTITVDGTIGPVTSTNILAWNLKVVQTTNRVWTEKDSNALNISGVSTDGQKIFVASSPDGILDGGTLYFGRAAGFGSIPTNAVIADFTQLSFNLGFGMGGIAGWQDEIGGLNYIGLNIRNNAQYRAASLVAGQPNVFRIHVPTLSTSPILMTMSGTFTTDGTIGPLLPQNILKWNITAKNQDIAFYSNTNSAVMMASGLSFDGVSLKVDHAAGQFLIGIAGPRPTFVAVADFTDPTMPNGFAQYYMGNFGVMGMKTPLVGNRALTYTVAN